MGGSNRLHWLSRQLAVQSPRYLTTASRTMSARLSGQAEVFETPGRRSFAPFAIAIAILRTGRE